VHAQQQQPTTTDHHHQLKRFLTEAEVEVVYGFPKKTLQSWRLRGDRPEFRKFGRSVKYDVRLLEAWIESLPSGGAGVPSSALATT